MASSDMVRWINQCCAPDCVCCSGCFVSVKSLLKVSWEMKNAADDCVCTGAWQKSVWRACFDTSWMPEFPIAYTIGGCAFTSSTPAWRGIFSPAECPGRAGSLRVAMDCEARNWGVELRAEEPDEQIWGLCLTSEDAGYNACDGLELVDLPESAWSTGVPCKTGSTTLSVSVEFAVNECCASCGDCCYHPESAVVFSLSTDCCNTGNGGGSGLDNSGQLVIPSTRLERVKDCGLDVPVFRSAARVPIQRGVDTSEPVDCPPASVSTGSLYLFVEGGCIRSGYRWRWAVSNSETIPAAAAECHVSTGACFNATNDCWDTVLDPDVADGVETCAGAHQDGTIAYGLGDKTVSMDLAVVDNRCCKDLDADVGDCDIGVVADCPCKTKTPESADGECP